MVSVEKGNEGPKRTLNMLRKGGLEDGVSYVRWKILGKKAHCGESLKLLDDQSLCAFLLALIQCDKYKNDTF